MKFEMKNVRTMVIPDGYPSEIRIDNQSMWARKEYLYVSLGDSIAAGHNINSNWESDYGERSQYQVPGDPPTTIVPGCYTDLLYQDIKSKFGEHSVAVQSFARSGDTVANLMYKLGSSPDSEHTRVADAVKRASLVTVSIGANDVLVPALEGILDYINSGDLTTIMNKIRENMQKLRNRNYEFSYWKLLEKLTSINPEATYVFLTMYNPYKYVWLDESTSKNDYADGFLGNIMAGVPNLNLFGLSLRGYLYNDLGLKDRIDRINRMSEIAESVVTELNDLISSEINAFVAAHEIKGEIKIADAKAVFDPVPDRLVGNGMHYNDLVNMEFTRGFVATAMDWGQIWEQLNSIHTVEALIGFLSGNVIGAILNYVFNTVIVPDMDVHPEEDGHYALKRAFADVLDGWEKIPRRIITYKAGEGSGAMEPQVVMALYPDSTYAIIRTHSFSSPTTGPGYRFLQWIEDNGVFYNAGMQIQLQGNMVLTAQWTDRYPVRIWADKNLEGYTGSEETGPKEYYGVFIDDVKYNLNRIGEWNTIMVQYGKEIGIVACTNDKRVAGKCSITTSDGQTVYGGDNGEYVDANLRYGALLGGKVYATTGIEVRFVWHYKWSELASWWTATQTTFDP